MNLRMSTSTIRMLFLSKNFNFFKKVSINDREGQQKFYSKELPFAVSNHNNEQ